MISCSFHTCSANVKKKISSNEWDSNNTWPISKFYSKIELKDLVFSWARAYATVESFNETTGEQINSLGLDEEMATDVYQEYMIERMYDLEEIVEVYGGDPHELNDLFLSIEETVEVAKSRKLKLEGKTNERSHNKEG